MQTKASVVKTFITFFHSSPQLN